MAKDIRIIRRPSKIEPALSFWLTSDNQLITVMEMETNMLFIAALEVIRKNYIHKDEWLDVFYKELKRKNRPDLITKIMLRNN